MERALTLAPCLALAGCSQTLPIASDARETRTTMTLIKVSL
jgi:hypothetical protein